MPKISPEKSAELAGFWRHHHEAWKQSPLNQHEYCELHGLPLKRFGNWRDRFKAEDKVRQAGLLYRRGGFGHVPGHMSDRDIEPVSTGYVPSGQALPEGRRNFRPSDKKPYCCRGDGAGRFRLGRGSALRDRQAAALPLEERAGAARTRSGVPAGDRE